MYVSQKVMQKCAYNNDILHNGPMVYSHKHESATQIWPVHPIQVIAIVFVVIGTNFSNIISLESNSQMA